MSAPQDLICFPNSPEEHQHADQHKWGFCQNRKGEGPETTDSSLLSPTMLAVSEPESS